MKKLTIFGVGNIGKFNYLIVKKEEKFFRWLKILLRSCFNGVYDINEE